MSHFFRSLFPSCESSRLSITRFHPINGNKYPRGQSFFPPPCFDRVYEPLNRITSFHGAKSSSIRANWATLSSGLIRSRGHRDLYFNQRTSTPPTNALRLNLPRKLLAHVLPPATSTWPALLILESIVDLGIGTWTFRRIQCCTGNVVVWKVLAVNPTK